MTTKRQILAGCAVLAIAGGFMEPAAAQSEQPAAAADETSYNEGDIIVTARRREETAQETPVALTVLNDVLLDRYGVKGIDSIASMTPGLFTGDSSGSVGGSISLRGVGSGDAAPFIDQAVSINVDGIQISTAQIQRVAQMDLKQIEVLRGPQALFFGKNSPGGIISLTTADPGDELEVMVRGGYEFKANERYADATVSTPLSDTAGLRIAGHYSKMDGYYKVISPVNLAPPGSNITPSSLKRFPNKEEFFLRGTLLLEPTDRLTINLKGTFAKTDIKGGPSYFSDIVYCPYGTPQELIVVPSNCLNDGTIVAAQIPASTLALNPLLRPDGHRDNKQGLMTATINYDLTDALKLTSVSGYYKVRELISSNGGYGLAATNVFTVRYSNEQFSEELRLASDFDGPIDFLLGGFYENRKLFTETYIVIPTAGNFELPVESTNQRQVAYSAFGQLLFDVTDQLQLTAGGRYSHEIKKLLDYTVRTAPFGTPVLSSGATVIDVTTLPTYPGTRLTFNNFSPEVTLTYKPTTDLMLFASFKKGFKSGGFDSGYTAGAILNPLRQATQTFKPEKVTGGEAGLKSELFDRQLTFNLTGYWYDYNNLQVTTYDTLARAFTTQNAAKSRVRGVELETRFRPRGVPGLSFHATAAYNDAKFREYLADCYKGQTVALGCNTTFVPSANQSAPPAGASLVNGVFGVYTTQDLAGVRLRKAPKFSATLGGYYETPVTSGLMVSLSADMNYSSKFNYGSTYQPFTIQDDYAQLAATLRLFTEDKRWELALIGRNLTNKLYQTNGIDRTGTGGNKGTTLPTCTNLSTPTTTCERLPDVIGTPAQPRSVALQFTFRY